VKRNTKPALTRKEKALETRRRMLRAAYELFCERGYAGTTMGAIADQAGVAVQTLYFTFHTKAAILSETIGASVLGFDRWAPPVDPIQLEMNDPDVHREIHPWFSKLEKEPDPYLALKVFTDASAEILSRVGPLAAVTTAAKGDPEVKAFSELGETRRVQSYGVILRMIAKKGPLRAGLTIQRGTDIMLAILSAETYQHLAARGWSKSDIKKWLFDLLAQQLLPPD
jgi:AcrR family transcriptional regulator